MMDAGSRAFALAARTPSRGCGEDVESFDEASEEDEEDSAEFLATWPNVALDADTFGLLVCSLVRDFHLLAKRKGAARNRVSRVATTLLMLGLCLSIQGFLLVQIKRFVSAKAVHDIRGVYDRFQVVMYHNHTRVFAAEPLLERRGIGGPSGRYFDAAMFDTLGDEEQGNVCRIPLSQPYFFFAVLYIWSLTCFAEIRKVKDTFLSLILRTEATDSMLKALEDDDGEPGGSEFVIARLPRAMKGALVVLVIIPRLCITSFLLWVGCRWLLATNNFADLILNAVALEFVLCLKDVMYLAIVSRRSMLDLENTLIKPANATEPESMAVLIGTVAWAFIAAAWVLGFMGWPGRNGFQHVLVDFQWDVHEVCSAWIHRRYAV
uniref:Uncharacterized protein n=1 Tax=Zooxanthella nutricula TaxID=1333877 RepID=A0A7S2PPB2_9DINO